MVSRLADVRWSCHVRNVPRNSAVGRATATANPQPGNATAVAHLNLLLRPAVPQMGAAKERTSGADSRGVVAHWITNVREAVK